VTVAEELDPRAVAPEETTILYVAYACLGLGLILPVLVPIAGVIIAYLKRNAPSPLLRAHAEWIIVTFWVTLVVGIVGAALILVLVGWLVLAVLWVWYIYRVVRGVVRLSERRPPKA
jgi:uncharacterized membrane protein